MVVHVQTMLPGFRAQVAFKFKLAGFAAWTGLLIEDRERDVSEKKKELDSDEKVSRRD